MSGDRPANRHAHKNTERSPNQICVNNRPTSDQACEQTDNEHWSIRDFARVLDYSDYRNFEQVIEKAKTACFNSGQRVEDHFVDITEMIEIGKGGQRSVKTAMITQSSSRQNHLPAGSPF